MPKINSQKGSVEISTIVTIIIGVAIIVAVSVLATKKYYVGVKKTAEPFAVVTPTPLAPTPTPTLNRLTLTEKNEFIKQAYKNIKSINTNFSNIIVTSETVNPYDENKLVLAIKFKENAYPHGVLIIDIAGKALNNQYVLEGSLEHLYISDIEWIDKNTLTFDEVVADESGIKKTPKTLKVLSIDDVSTADWKTYRNQVNGYEIKYPSIWSISDKSNTKLKIYSIVLNQSGISANPMLAITKNPAGVGYEFLKFNPPEIIEIGKVAVQKRSFKSTTELLFSNCVSATEGGYHILLNKEKDEYEIWATYCKSENDFNPKIFDKILSTFKFIE